MVESGRSPQVAVVGVGYWGKNLARNFAELGALAAVVDNHPATAADVAAACNVSARSFDEVLSDAEIDGVAIATRAETHHQLASRALEAGKDVFVEKPLVLDASEADALISQAEGLGRVLMVGHLLRYHPIFERMLELVGSGKFGGLRYVASERLSLGKIRTEEDVLWSFAPHDISMVLALAGEAPAGVTAQGAAFINPSINDFVTAQLAFPGGLKAELRASWMHYRKVQRLTAICDNATLVFEDSEPEWSRKLAIHAHSVTEQNGVPIPSRGEVSYVEVGRAEPLKLECTHFLDCIAGRARPRTDGSEGKDVLRVLRQATEAMARG